MQAACAMRFFVPAEHENPFDASKHQHVLKQFEDHLFHAPDHHHSSYPIVHHPEPAIHHQDPHYVTGHDPHHHAEVHYQLPDIHHHPDSHHHPPDGQHHHQIGHHDNSHYVPSEVHYKPTPIDHLPVANPHPEIHHLPINPHLHAANLHHDHKTLAILPQAPHLSPDPHKIVNPNAAISTVVAKNRPLDPHDSHHHLTTILDKLRNENSGDHSNLMWHRRNKRSLFGKWKTKTEEDDVYRPTVITHEDRWLAGCLMQCVFRKNDAVDKHGYPTLDGLTDLYTAGTTEQAFFIHVLRAVDNCLKSASVKHQIYRGKKPVKGETCDVAFDVFDCVSDSITEYCS